MSHARRLTALLIISLAADSSAVSAASLFDPALRFRVRPTEHFIIYFHQGEDRLAARLASIAEETWLALRPPFGTPPRLTHVVLVDQWELANGYATPLPRDTVVVSAAWPAAVDFIGDTDDWLRMVFTHEFTHIVHLDRSEGWARAVRRLLGRSMIAFPNLFLPIWQIEGLATYEESVVTGMGRLHAGDFRAIVGEGAREHAVQPLDRVNGGLTDWPSGLAPYAYGLGFHEYLADRFGHASLGRLADVTSRRFPYLTAGAFKKVFSESLGALWDDFEATLRNAPGSATGSDAGLTKITRHGFVSAGPRFDRFRNDSIVYAVRTPHDFPALNRVSRDGSSPDRITRRYLGTNTTVADKALYFDQQEIRRNVGVYSDLYALSRTDNHVTRLTRDARLLDPDVSPDGTTIACVQQKPGQRDLVLVRLSADITEAATVDTPVASGSRRTVHIATLIAEPDTQFNGPRWSPDGRTIAVERHRLGGLSQVVLVDVSTKTVRPLAWSGPARLATPAWRPDGGALVVAVAPQEEPFNLYEFTVGAPRPLRQLTHTTGGAMWPDVSADGRTVVFVGYTVQGFDLFTLPYPPEIGDGNLFPAADAENAENLGEKGDGGLFPAVDAEKAEKDAEKDSRPLFSTPYSPLPTLRPTSWSPVIENGSNYSRVGAAVAGFDVLAYHFYTAAATWLVFRPSDAPSQPSTPDWNVSYSYIRWRPVFWVAADSSTSFFAEPADGDGLPIPVTLRERQVEGGMVFPVTHARVSHRAFGSLLRSADEFTTPDGSRSRDRAAARGGWTTNTAHTYGYSISPERGFTVGGTLETVRRALGSSSDGSTATGDLRVYAPLPAAHHVLAVRAAGGVSSGDLNARRIFHLGGPGPNASVVSFGRDAMSLMRGFPSDRFAGSHAALLNVDYRFPIARPQRGVETWPLFLHTIHAAAFADVGHVWTDAFHATAVKTSIGGELSTDIVAGYFFPFTAAAGVAWGHDGAGATRDRATYYFRIGRAF